MVVNDDTSALKKWRQEAHGFNTSLDYIVKPYLKKVIIYSIPEKKIFIFWGGGWKGRNVLILKIS